jgi:putative oxidoreductase
LVIISMVYIIRGIFGIPIVIYIDHPYLNELEEKMTFMIFSSIISLSLGLFYLVGSMQTWSNNTNQRHITKDK